MEVAGQRIAYVDRGDGPAVVCVHGNPTWGWYYRDLVAGLSDRHRVVASDHVGMGRSSRPTRSEYPHTLERRISDLGAVIDAVVGRGPVDLVVHDWGGPIGLGWAVRHPERVGRVLAMNTAAFPLPDAVAFPWLLRLARTPLGAAATTNLNAFVRGTVWLGSTSRLDRRAARGYLEPYRQRGSRTAVQAFVEDIPLDASHPSWATLADVGERLGVLDGRVLLCWGMRDPVFTPDLLPEWRRRLPHVEVVEIPDAGHLVLEDAGPRVLDLARRHLTT